MKCLAQSTSWWTLTRGRWTAFVLNGNCSYFSGEDKPLITAQGGAARLTVRGLGSGPHPAPCLSPAAYASFLMRAATLQSTGRWFWAKNNLSHCWKHSYWIRVYQREEAEGKGGRARTVVDRVWAIRGTPMSLLLKLNSICSLSLEFLFSFSRSSTIGHALDI